jgi:hypothetical protein
MFTVVLLVGAQSFRLMYHSEEKARQAANMSSWTDVLVYIEDDFGQEFSGRRNSISGCVFEDLEKSKLAHVELALHQQRMQFLAQKMASADPGLRTMAAMNGPGVITPFPRN